MAPKNITKKKIVKQISHSCGPETELNYPGSMHHQSRHSKSSLGTIDDSNVMQRNQTIITGGPGGNFDRKTCSRIDANTTDIPFGYGGVKDKDGKLIENMDTERGSLKSDELKDIEMKMIEQQQKGGTSAVRPTTLNIPGRDYSFSFFFGVMLAYSLFSFFCFTDEPLFF